MKFETKYLNFSLNLVSNIFLIARSILNAIVITYSSIKEEGLERKSVTGPSHANSLHIFGPEFNQNLKYLNPQIS